MHEHHNYFFIYWPYSPLTHLASYISPLIDYFCQFNEKSLTENGTYAGKIADIIKNTLPQPGFYDFFFCVCSTIPGFAMQKITEGLAY